MEHKLNLIIMSGVQDGSLLEYLSSNGDGEFFDSKWTLSIGRRDDNDICLYNDTYISRVHAKLHWMRDDWWLEDCQSTNGTFLDNPEDFFEDLPVKGIIPIRQGQLFRIGRTWLSIQTTE